ncbi:MAG: helix-turn-helix domain-containing protein [Myxococcota bacterium]
MEGGRKPSFGEMLRTWRRIRDIRQADVAFRTGSSARHLSVLENGKAMPSEALLDRLCDVLEIPPRERLLLRKAAGFGPFYAPIDLASENRDALRASLSTLLDVYQPLPAWVATRQGDHLFSNAAFEHTLAAWAWDRPLFQRGCRHFAELIVSDEGLAPFVVDLDEVKRCLFYRLSRDALIDDESGSMEGFAEHLRQLGGPDTPLPVPVTSDVGPVLRLTLAREDERLELELVTTTVGTVADVTLQTLRLECLVPIDDATRTWFEQRADAEVPHEDASLARRVS